MKSRVLVDLEELAKGKTLREKIQAHTEYYDSCSLLEQEFLMEIFKQEEQKEIEELAIR